MRLTAIGDYAVRVIVELAGRPPGLVLRTEELGQATGVPRPYLAKITQMLARAGLVRTQRGASGGVALARDPTTVTLRQMVEAVEGPIVLNRCLARAGECPRDVFCGVHPVWARVQAVLLRELEAVTARDLAGLTAIRRDGVRRKDDPATRSGEARVGVGTTDDAVGGTGSGVAPAGTEHATGTARRGRRARGSEGR